MTATMKKMSHLNNDKLNVIADEVVDNLDEILEYFEVKYHKNNTKYYGPCPIHDGTGEKNPWNLYHTGDIYRGNWKCRSHGCEQIFKKTVIGFIRGLLSKKEHKWSQNGDPTVSFNDTLNWISKWLKKDLKDIKVDLKQMEKRRFIANVGWLNKADEKPLNINRADIRASLSLPSAYFKSRGFTPEILDKYDIGDCRNLGKEMSHRAVVPIYDEGYHKVIGCTGRSIFPRCDKCRLWHSPAFSCPPEEYKARYVKWKHNTGLRAENHLFNLWFAKDYINKFHSVVLVESPGNVLRLEEAGVHNVLATFGSNLGEKQLSQLYKYEIFTVNLLYDNDAAGQQAIINISKMIDRIFNVRVIKLVEPFNDIGELTIQQTKDIIVPQVAVHKESL
jgi:5S rRNA maturation endonuclease (ribonuclease M5)